MNGKRSPHQFVRGTHLALRRLHGLQVRGLEDFDEPDRPHAHHAGALKLLVRDLHRDDPRARAVRRSADEVQAGQSDLRERHPLQLGALHDAPELAGEFAALVVALVLPGFLTVLVDV